MCPVVNLKSLNEFVQKIHFRMENILMDLNFITREDSMISIDLKDAYFSVPIFSSSPEIFAVHVERPEI